MKFKLRSSHCRPAILYMLGGNDPDRALTLTSRRVRAGKEPAAPQLGGRAPVNMLLPRFKIFKMG